MVVKKINGKKLHIFSIMAFLAVFILIVCGGLNIGFNLNETETSLAAWHSGGRNDLQLTIDDDIPIGEAKTYRYGIMDGSGDASNYSRAFHRYSDGTERENTLHNSSMELKVRNISEGGCIEFYGYYRLPEELIYNKANLSISMQYSITNNKHLASATSTITSCVMLPTDGNSRGSSAGGLAKNTNNNTGNFKIENFVTNANIPYLRLGFLALCNKDINNVTLTDYMEFAVSNIVLEIKVLDDGAAPTITPWELKGGSLEMPHEVFANTTNDLQLLFDAYYNLENNGKVFCHNLKRDAENNLDSLDSPSENYFTSWQNIDEKIITFVVYDKFMGLKKVTVNGFEIPHSKNKTILTKADLIKIMEENQDLDLQGISKIEANSFGYKTDADYTGKFRGMQIKIHFDCKDNNNEDIIGNKDYQIIGTDNSDLSKSTSVTIGGIDNDMPEVPKFNIDNEIKNGWFFEKDLNYYLSILKQDPKNNVKYYETLILCDENGINEATIFEHQEIDSISFGNNNFKNKFYNLTSGFYKYKIIAVDGAGNYAESDIINFKLDHEIPDCNINLYEKNTSLIYECGKWSNKAIEINFAFNDNVSGCYYQYKINNGEWLTDYNSKIILGDDGKNVNDVFTFCVISNAGLSSKEVSTGEKIMIDTTSPNQPFSNTLVSYYDVETGYDGTAPVSMYIDIYGDIEGQDKQYGDLFHFYYTVGDYGKDGKIVYGAEQHATMTEAILGEAVINFYENGIPDFENIDYIKKNVKMWCVDQAGNWSENSVFDIYLLPPVIYVDFEIDENASKIFDNTNFAQDLCNLIAKNSKQENLLDIDNSVLKERIIKTTFSNEEIILNYKYGDTVFINNTRYILTKDGLKGSGFELISADNSLSEIKLKVVKADSYLVSNFTINFKLIFDNCNAGIRNLKLDVLPSGKYIELIGDNLENYTIKYKCSDGRVIDLAKDGEDIIIGQALIEKAKILMFMQKNEKGEYYKIRANDKIYDGTNLAYISNDVTTFICTTFVNGEGWKYFTWYGDLAFSDPNVNIENNTVLDKIVTIKNLQFKGDLNDLENYEIINSIDDTTPADNSTEFYVKAKILRRKLIVDLNSTVVKNKCYDRTNNAEMEKFALKGIDDENNILLGEEVLADYNVEFDTIAVNENAVVNLKNIKLKGQNSDNYVYVGLNLVKLNAEIKKRPLTIKKLTVKNRKYDGTNNAELDDYKLDGILTFDHVKLYCTNAYFETENAGSCYGMVYGLFLDETSNINYELVDAEGNLITEAKTTEQAEIYKKEIKIEAKADNKTYDGNTLTVNPEISLDGVLENERIYIGEKVENLNNVSQYKGANFVFNNGDKIPVCLYDIAFVGANASTQTGSVISFVYGKYVKYDENLHKGETRYNVVFEESNNEAFYILENGYYVFYDREIHEPNQQKYAVDEVNADENGAYILELNIYNEDGTLNNNYIVENNILNKKGLKLSATTSARIEKKQAKAEIVGIIATDIKNNILYKDNQGNLYIKFANDLFDKFDLNGNKIGSVPQNEMRGNMVILKENDIEYGGFYTINNKEFRLNEINFLVKYEGGIKRVLHSLTVNDGECEEIVLNYREGETIYINGVKYVVGVSEFENVTYNGMFNDKISLTFTSGEFIIEAEEKDVFRENIENPYTIYSDVGNYLISLERILNDNYDFTNNLKNFNLNIKPAKLEISLNDFIYNYGDKFILDNLKINFKGFRNGDNFNTFGDNLPKLTLLNNKGDIVVINDEIPLPVGKYILQIDLPSLGNYTYAVPELYIGDVPVYVIDESGLVIRKKNAIVINLGTLSNVTFSDESISFTNKAIQLLAKGYPTNAIATYKYYLVNSDGTETLIEGADGVINAGEYKVYVTIKGKNDSYGYAEYNASATLFINKANIKLAIESKKEINYNGKKIEISPAKMTPDQSITNISFDDIDYTYSETIDFERVCDAPKNPGKYYVRAFFKGNNNYDECYSNIATIQINYINVPIIIKCKKFDYNDYFNEKGVPLNGVEFKGIEFEIPEEFKDCLDYLTIEYLIDGYFEEDIPEKLGTYYYQILIDSPYKLVGNYLSGIMILGESTVKSIDETISVTTLEGALPSVGEKGDKYYPYAKTFASDENTFSNFNIAVLNNTEYLGGKYEINELYDIEFYNSSSGKVENGKVVGTGNEKLIVKMKLKAPFKKNMKLVYIANDGQIKELATTFDKGSKILTFETDTLGKFAIIAPSFAIDVKFILIICGVAVLILFIVALIISSMAKKQKKLYQYPIKLASDGNSNANNEDLQNQNKNNISINKNEINEIKNEIFRDISDENKDLNDNKNDINKND